MTSEHPAPGGLWLPLVTPFKTARSTGVTAPAGAYHAEEPLDGLILAATTGEGLTSTMETERPSRLAELVAPAGACHVPRPAGKRHAQPLKALAHTASWPLDGYLIACPYYTRPSQDGWCATSRPSPRRRRGRS